jgi:hypothetical protein
MYGLIQHILNVFTFEIKFMYLNIYHKFISFLFKYLNEYFKHVI